MLSGTAPYDGRMTTDAALPSAATASSPWWGLVLRAVPAAVVGIVITFTANHSATVGLWSFAAFGITSGVVLAVSSRFMSAADPLRALHLGLSLIAGIAGALALAALLVLGSGLPTLLLLVGGYAVVGGALELVWGIRHRGRHAFARDAVVIGVATMALAVVLALVGDPVSAVGFFGAYAVVLAIFLLIAGFSLKWSTPVKESSAS
ncbi:MAG: hypothetical protein RL499_1109 [Actinomycetota bacterium]